jgi:ribosomal protein S27AE
VPRVWAWTFMANHIDRNYCGNCRFSFVFDEESGGVV